MIFDMAVDMRDIHLVIGIEVILKMVKQMELEFINGSQENSMMEIGNKGARMVMECGKG